MSDNLSNEYSTSPDGNKIRPYTVGFTRHTETPATIILYTSDNSKNTEEGVEIDYFSQFTSKVPALNINSSQSTDSLPINPSGKAAIIKLDDVNNYYGIFNNFSLTSVEESDEQIVKVHQNFGSGWNAFFFGKKPSVYRFSGVLIDTQEYPYYQEFMVAYEKFLCGRNCIENKMQTIVFYDGRLVDGYLISIATTHTAADQVIKPFNFTVLVKSTAWVRFNMTVLPDGYVATPTLNRLKNYHRMDRYLNSGSLSPDNGQFSEV